MRTYISHFIEYKTPKKVLRLNLWEHLTIIYTIYVFKVQFSYNNLGIESVRH